MRYKLWIWNLKNKTLSPFQKHSCKWFPAFSNVCVCVWSCVCLCVCLGAVLRGKAITGFHSSICSVMLPGSSRRDGVWRSAWHLNSCHTWWSWLAGRIHAALQQCQKHCVKIPVGVESKSWLDSCTYCIDLLISPCLNEIWSQRSSQWSMLRPYKQLCEFNTMHNNTN